MPDPAFAPPLYQSFDRRSDKRTIAPRLAALRAEMAAASLDGFLVPRADAHRGESVPPGEARLAWLTGFTGSAGIALVGAKRAALYVDGRYALQAPAETNARAIAVVVQPQANVPADIARIVPTGGRIGYDPWLHTPREIAELEARLAGQATLVASPNLVDRIWTDRPGAPVSPAEFLGPNRAGRTAADKLAELKKTLAADDLDAVVLTLPESIDWLFNMRGRDVPHTPFVLGFAIVPRTGRPTFYADRGRLTRELRQGLKGLARAADVSTLMADLRALGAGDKRVQVDPETVPVAIVAAIRGVSEAVVVEKRDPVLLPKAKKNQVEIGGMKEAHLLDGVAMAKFLCWFDGAAPKGGLTEIDIVTALEAFRREDESVADISFDTIAGAGPNGAVIHYRVDRVSNRALKPGELMLVDSGAQYLSGTTDITRTLFTGKANAEQRDRFTRVLKGMIAISMARFPRGTTGTQIDVLARQFLWADGVTYNHGTGHGVGHFLGVHEGPIGISSRYHVAFEPGMIVSNEPGYYKDGAWGIRIENLILVVESTVGDGKYLEFETLTLAPIDRRLIDPKLLTDTERNWLDAYHRRVFREIGPRLRGEVKAWLKDATRPLAA